ncbi:hypothetical protein F4805DRAFT_410722 [Annulohypoxylon moriforme]|nr:hypothetical protein F4805DRAFT_410722 [Annulohypoxylon moriforme]
MAIDGAEFGVLDQLSGHVEFMAHELFDRQPVQADMYFFRMILHNWPDKIRSAKLQSAAPTWSKDPHTECNSVGNRPYSVMERARFVPQWVIESERSMLAILDGYSGCA